MQKSWKFLEWIQEGIRMKFPSTHRKWPLSLHLCDMKTGQWLPEIHEISKIVKNNPRVRFFDSSGCFEWPHGMGRQDRLTSCHTERPGMVYPEKDVDCYIASNIDLFAFFSCNVKKSLGFWNIYKITFFFNVFGLQFIGLLLLTKQLSYCFWVSAGEYLQLVICNINKKLFCF